MDSSDESYVTGVWDRLTIKVVSSTAIQEFSIGGALSLGKQTI